MSRSLGDFESVSGEMLRVLNPGGIIVTVDIPHMLEAFAIRTEKAGLQTEFRDFNEHKMLVGRKPISGGP